MKKITKFRDNLLLLALLILVILFSPIKVSADYPGEWQRLDVFGGGGFVAVAVHPSNPNIAYLASDLSGVVKTTNGGDTWVNVSSNLGAYRGSSIALDPLDPEVIYYTAATSWTQSGPKTGEVFRSTNGGQSWQ
ncbi:WD40/YVTN/BNR-like repeat-containing protein, partial [Patescibacteria group bacterium]